MWSGFTSWVVMVLPAGAFITLGLLVGLFNVIDKKMKEGKKTEGAGQIKGHELK
jgi:hypothetical protein